MSLGASIFTRIVLCVPGALFVACGGTSSEGAPTAERCGVVGKSEACACDDGARGAQICQPDGRFGACVCRSDPYEDGGIGAGSGGRGEPSAGGAATGGSGGSGGTAWGAGGVPPGAGASPSAGGAAAGECRPGDAAGCRCSDDALSYRPCEEGAFGPCVCPDDLSPDAGAGAGGQGAGDSGACVVETEWCDGRDNDCSGVADDRFACPDDAVLSTKPFDDGVYFLGTTSEGSCGADALQQFWPTLSTTHLSGFDCYANWFGFRPNDDALFYSATFSGIYRDGGSSTTSDELLLTPPCGDRVASVFGFDGAGTLHYSCDATLRRGNGETVAGSIEQIAGVLADGRVVVTRGGAYVVLDVEGNELSRFPPADHFTGDVVVDPGATTISGNDAFVALLRTYDQATEEIVVYRVDAESAWRLVRRVRTRGFGMSHLVLSDGTVFVRERDTTTTFDEQIRVYLPDGSQRITWREAEAVEVRAHIGDELLTGPLTE